MDTDHDKFLPLSGWRSPIPNSGVSSHGYYVGGELKGKVPFFSTRKQASDAAKSVGYRASDVTKVHTRFHIGWAIFDGNFGLISAEWYLRQPGRKTTIHERAAL